MSKNKKRVVSLSQLEEALEERSMADRRRADEGLPENVHKDRRRKDRRASKKKSPQN